MALESAWEIYLQAREEVDDDSYEFEDYLKQFNKALKDISGRVLLPALETSADIYAGTATITASTISFTATGKIIADSDSALVTSGFHVGETITITGAGEDTNNQTTTISSIESDGSQMVVAGTLADESAGEEVTIESSGPNNIPLPSGYQRNLFYCYSNDHYRPIKIYASRGLLMRDVGRIDQAGRVIGVAVYGSRFYYQRIPSSTESLTMWYYEQPTAMTERTDTPDCLPEHLATQLLCNYARWRFFAQIEDGIEGAKVNTEYWKGEYEVVMAELQAFVGDEGKIPTEIPDEMYWEEMV